MIKIGGVFATFVDANGSVACAEIAPLDHFCFCIQSIRSGYTYLACFVEVSCLITNNDEVVARFEAAFQTTIQHNDIFDHLNDF